MAQLAAVRVVVGSQIALEQQVAESAPMPTKMVGVHVPGEDPALSIILAALLWCRHRRWHDGVCSQPDLEEFGARVTISRLANIVVMGRNRVARIIAQLVADGVVVEQADELGLDVRQEAQAARRARGVMFRWDTDLASTSATQAVVVGWVRNELNKRTAWAVPRIATTLGLPHNTVRDVLRKARDEQLVGRILERGHWWVVSSEADRHRAEQQRPRLAARRQGTAPVASSAAPVASSAAPVASSTAPFAPPSSGVSGVLESLDHPSRRSGVSRAGTAPAQTALRADDPIPNPIHRGPRPSRVPTVLDVAKAEQAGQRRLANWGTYSVTLKEAAAIAHANGSETTTVLVVLALLGVLVAPAHWNAAGQASLRRTRQQLAAQLVAQGVHASQLVEQAVALADRTRSSSPSAVAAQLLRSLQPKDSTDAGNMLPMGAGADGLALAAPTSRVAYWHLLSDEDREAMRRWFDELDAIVAPVVAHVVAGTAFATKATERAVRDQTRQASVLRDLEDARRRNDQQAVAELMLRAHRLGVAVEDIQSAVRVG